MDCLFLFLVVPLVAWADFLAVRGLARKHAGPQEEAGLNKAAGHPNPSTARERRRKTPSAA
jgi:hypothetical protein